MTLLNILFQAKKNFKKEQILQHFWLLPANEMNNLQLFFFIFVFLMCELVPSREQCLRRQNAQFKKRKLE